MSDSAAPPTDPSQPVDGTQPDGPAPDQRRGDEPWAVRIPAKVLALVGTVVAAVLVAVLVVAVVVNRGPDSPMEVVDDFIAAAEAGTSHGSSPTCAATCGGSGVRSRRRSG